jgi:LacI family transcriptional regulator
VHGVGEDISMAVRIIREHQGIGIWPAELADRVGISLSKLERGVKDALGRTPMQEILRLRLQAAKQMIRETDLPMKLIATRCGFRTSKYFFEAIRKDTGFSPRQIRAESRSSLPANAPIPSREAS